MQTRMKVIKLFTSFIVSVFAINCFTPVNANAGYLIQPLPCYYDECRPVKIVKVYQLKKHYPVKHIKKIRHHKKYRHYLNTCYSCQPCAYDCRPQREFVEFRAGPAPSGCYLNLDDCDNYVPDRNTADDDPMVYPGMDIDE